MKKYRILLAVSLIVLAIAGTGIALRSTECKCLKYARYTETKVVGMKVTVEHDSICVSTGNNRSGEITVKVFENQNK